MSTTTHNPGAFSCQLEDDWPRVAAIARRELTGEEWRQYAVAAVLDECAAVLDECDAQRRLARFWRVRADLIRGGNADALDRALGVPRMRARIVAKLGFEPEGES